MAKKNKMFLNGQGQFANMPQASIMKEYPSTPYFNYDLNDDIRGIDVQIADDMKKQKRKRGQAYPEKW